MVVVGLSNKSAINATRRKGQPLLEQKNRGQQHGVIDDHDGEGASQSHG